MIHRGKHKGEPVPDGIDHEPLVELTRVAYFAEATAIRQDLERVGISATVFESDGGGWVPYLSIEQGNRVMIHARDLEQAKELLSEHGGQLACDQLPPDNQVRKHLRPHIENPST